MGQVSSQQRGKRPPIIFKPPSPGTAPGFTPAQACTSLSGFFYTRTEASSMRIQATIDGQQYLLDYGTNPRGQVAGVTIYSADGQSDLSFSLDGTPTEYKAWDIAIQHNAARTSAIPVIVEVPHVLESTPKKWAAAATQATTDPETAGADALAEHIAATSWPPSKRLKC